jgi:nitrate reductase NapE
MEDSIKPATRSQELKTFLALTVVAAPVMAVMAVGGYGFFIWMYQLMTGTLPTG